MSRVIDGFCRLLDALIALALALMVVLVFGNVVLRYGFNSGITVSEEMSRYCFIWLTYIGAMVAMLAQGDHGAQEGHPDEEPARHLLGHRDAGIEAVAKHDVAEDQHHHHRQHEGDEELDAPADPVDHPIH